MIVGLWLGLNFMDLITTLLALELGCTEGNGIIASLGPLEPTELAVYKVGLSLGALALLSQWKKLRLLRYLCAVMGMVVIWNSVWVI